MSIQASSRNLLYLKLACGLVCCIILLSNIRTISHWNESRGVYDDVCYLRQAHLFQKFGVDGLNTDIARDDDHYLASKLKAIGFAGWNDPAAAPCHTEMPKTGRRVLQYPPGTGFMLALFPAEFQVIPLYVTANVIIFGFALLGIFYARSGPGLAAAAVFGWLAIDLMVNPSKASYSMAPTMMACAAAGLLTAQMFLAKAVRSRILLSALVGLLIGLAVNFRLPNLFLASGYLLFFAVAFLRARSRATFLQAAAFGMACLAGMTPTLIANAINAGSPLTTTYGSVDATAPAFSLGVILQYVHDLQFVLLLIAVGSTALAWRIVRDAALRQTAWVSAGNLAFNLAFFLSHPLFTPYYIVPVVMLSLWSLLFASVRPGAAWLRSGETPARAMDHAAA
jgi:hypothetical protein